MNRSVCEGRYTETVVRRRLMLDLLAPRRLGLFGRAVALNGLVAKWCTRVNGSRDPSGGAVYAARREGTVTELRGLYVPADTSIHYRCGSSNMELAVIYRRAHILYECNFAVSVGTRLNRLRWLNNKVFQGRIVTGE